jgi:hypothetical protein
MTAKERIVVESKCYVMSDGFLRVTASKGVNNWISQIPSVEANRISVKTFPLEMYW